ncbi:DegT/DnrJ/EryC1/StrS family aminotransferase [Amycolatopsis sp. H6(2020)]|nr:DegT/DnrJ/EryC1/StrS family aminotransferase [Amycolatopsis sp. H6(2020)]
MLEKLAVLGGTPEFAEPVPLVRPTLPSPEQVMTRAAGVFASGQITNAGQVRAFEAELSEFLGVGHVVAVGNCTVGLMLVLRCLGLSGDVVVPSFTFMASGHAALWNDLGLRFADSSPRTCTIDPVSAAEVAPGSAAVLATHTFGAPCDVESLERLGVPVVFDAAHAFGSRYPDGTMVGTKGVAEVFSLSPTKPLSAGEGGVIATGDADLACDLRIARDYGNPGNYNATVVGLNGRLPELSAVLGRTALETFPYWLERRRDLVKRYQTALEDVPGIAFQEVPAGAVSVYKDFAVRVDHEFGVTRDAVARVLAAESVATRPYFDPPLHRQNAYRTFAVTTSLADTERLSRSMLTLPLYNHMDPEIVDRISELLRQIHVNRNEVSTAS